MALKNIVVLDESGKIPATEVPAHAIDSHDTSATGEQLDELVGGGTSYLHSHTAGAGDMTKAVYDPDEDGIIAPEQLDLSGKADAAHTHPGGSEAFPVGSVFLAVVDTDPATLLGYGTWTQIAQGQFLVGQKAADPDFDVAEETGGEKAHTLTVAEMPVHTHVQNAHRHQTLRERSATTGSQSTQIARTADASSTIDTAIYTENTTATNQNAGGGSAHNNLPPYLVVYAYKRTA